MFKYVSRQQSVFGGSLISITDTCFKTPFIVDRLCDCKDNFCAYTSAHIIEAYEKRNLYPITNLARYYLWLERLYFGYKALPTLDAHALLLERRLPKLKFASRFYNGVRICIQNQNVAA